MRNVMRSLWDFDAGDWNGEEDEPAPPATNEEPGAGSASFDRVQGNIGDQIQARLQAGHPPGRIAMDLERVRPGLGRALLSELQQAARSGPSGSTSEVVNPLLAKGNGPEMPPGDRYAHPQFGDATESARAMRRPPQFGLPYSASGVGALAPPAAGKPPRLSSARSGEEDETAPLATDEVTGAMRASLDQVQENIGDQIRARLQAGHPPGRIAMDLEQLTPGLGRAMLSELQWAGLSTPSGTRSEGGHPFLTQRVNGPLSPATDRYAPPQLADAAVRNGASRRSPQLGPTLPPFGARAIASMAAGRPPLLSSASINSAAAHRNMAAKTPVISAKRSGQRHDPSTFWSRVGGLLNQGRGFFDPGTTVINRDGSRYKRFRDGSIEMQLPPPEPFRKPRPQRMAAAARGQANARQTPAATLPYNVKEGVTIDDFVAGKLLEMGKIFTKETGKRLTVTDGTRTARQQASAMYHDFEGGESGGKYHRKDLVRPIYDAYVAARKRKASPAATINEMAAIIEGQLRNGDVISKHLLKKGIDLRTRGLTRDERGALERAARKVGVRLDDEGDHLHGEF